MKSLHRLAVVLWLALALVAGQHAALLHDLGHAADLAQKQDTKPGQSQCDKCYAFAQLIGAPSTVFAVPAVVVAIETPRFVDASAATRRVTAYRSQAPPNLL
jgi:HD superfamily phosphodiesterase